MSIVNYFYDAYLVKSEKSGAKNPVVVQHPTVGEVQFVSSDTAKYIRISLKPFGGIRVTVPKRASVRQAMAFVDQKTDWILQAQKRIAVHENNHTVFTPETVFSTHSRRLQLLPWKTEQFRAQLAKDSLKIFYPQDADILSDNAQARIRDYIEQTLRKEAREYLPQRTGELAVQHGFTYHGVTVKNVSSRWGSCSATNHINLNIHLMRLPQHLSDYVILHELAHTIHKNHSARFWNCLDEYTGGKAKRLAAEMRQFHTNRY